MKLIEDDTASSRNEHNTRLELQPFKKVRNIIAFLERPPVCPHLLPLGGKINVYA